MKFDRKRKEVETWKGRISQKTSLPNALEEISKEVGSSIESVAPTSLSDLKLVSTNKGVSYRLANSEKFWEALASNPFGKKMVVGPLNDNDKQVYVEFGDLSFGSSKTSKPEPSISDFSKDRQLLGFFVEINQSLAQEYNIEKKGILATE